MIFVHVCNILITIQILNLSNKNILTKKIQLSILPIQRPCDKLGQLVTNTDTKVQISLEVMNRQTFFGKILLTKPPRKIPKLVFTMDGLTARQRDSWLSIH